MKRSTLQPLFMAFLLVFSSIFPLIMVEETAGTGSGSYPVPKTGNWVIRNDTVVHDETIILNGDLIVEAGGNLTLHNSTLLFNCSYDGQYDIVVKDGGQFRVFGQRGEASSQGTTRSKHLLYTGTADGWLIRFKNNGSASNPNWVREEYVTDQEGDKIDVGSFSTPSFVDLDADGDLDLVLGEGSENLNFFRNLGNDENPIWKREGGMFSGVGLESRSRPAFGDLDDDGDMDLAIGYSDGHLEYYENIGTSQDPEWTQDTGSLADLKDAYYATPAFADLDSDGDLDLTIGDDEGDLNYYENTGSSEEAAWSSGSTMFLGIDVGVGSKPAFCDLDGDGDLDLTIGNRNGELTYYENTGGNWRAEWSQNREIFGDIDVGTDACPAYITIDTSQDLDMILGTSDGSLKNYRNNGTKQQPEWEFLGTVRDEDGDPITSSSYVAPFMADIDADGDLDLTLGQTMEGLLFYRNTGTAQEPVWTEADKMYEDVETGYSARPNLEDLDDDGDLDLILGQSDGSMQFYRNDGTPEIPSWVEDTSVFGDIKKGTGNSPCFADLDDDGDLDLSFGTVSSGLFYFENTGTPELPEWTKNDSVYDVISEGMSPRPNLQDLDNDGDFDLILSNSELKIRYYENVGGAAGPKWKMDKTMFEDVESNYYSMPAFGDLDGDGYLSKPGTDNKGRSKGSSVEGLDLNILGRSFGENQGSGDLDLTIGAWDGNLNYFQNIGGKEIPEWELDSSLFGTESYGIRTSPCFGDLDDDSDIDVIIGMYQSASMSTAFLHLENIGSRKEPVWLDRGRLKDSEGENITGEFYPSPYLADLDDDGDLDLTFGDYLADKLFFYRNTGTAQEPQWTEDTSVYEDTSVDAWCVPTLVDLDDNGKLELVTGGNRGQLQIFLNTGSPKSPTWDYQGYMKDSQGENITSHDTLGSFTSAPVFGDLDDDRDLDLLIGNRDGKIYLYENTGSTSVASWEPVGFLVDTIGQDIDVGNNAFPALGDLDADEEQSAPRPGGSWLTRISTTGQFSFDFLVEEGGVLELHDTKITNCGDNRPDHQGLRVEADSVTITGNCFQGNPMAIFLKECELGQISGNSFINNSIAIQGRDLSTLTISGNIFSRNTQGIRLEDSNQLQLTGNYFQKGDLGIHLDSCQDMILKRLELGSLDLGIVVSNSENLSLRDTEVSFGERAVILLSSPESHLRSVNVTDASLGMIIRDSEETQISQCRLKDNKIGILVEESPKLNISASLFTDSKTGIHIRGSSSAHVLDCEFADCEEGLVLEDSMNGRLLDNDFSGCSLLLEGDRLEHYLSHKLVSNTVNGAALRFVTNLSQETISGEPGALIMVNCSDMKVEDLYLASVSAGIQMAFVNDSEILGNTILESHYGLVLKASSRNLVDGNIFADGKTGILMKDASRDNVIRFNTMDGNDAFGINATANQGQLVNAEKNFWGASSGPYHPAQNPDATGDPVSDNVDFIPWLRAAPGENHWYVDSSASPGGDGSFANPFVKIQNAVDNASKGEEIEIAPGLYLEQVVIRDKSLHLLAGSSEEGDVFLDALGGTAMTLEGELPIILEGLIFRNASTGIQNANRETFVLNSNLSGVPTPFSISQDCELTTVDSLFKLEDVVFGGGTATLYEKNSLVVFVHDYTQNPVSGVSVKVFNASSGQVESTFTREDGRTESLVLTHRIAREGGTELHSPYAIVIQKGEMQNNATVNLSAPNLVSLLWYDITLFGSTLTIGDIDGDGVEDYAVGAPGFDGKGKNDTGAVFIYRGRDGLVMEDLRFDNYDWAIYGGHTTQRFGSSVTMNGDLDGDGCSDLSVWAPGYNDTEPLGVRAQYYRWAEGKKFNQLVGSEVVENLNFDWGYQSPMAGLGPDEFSVRYSGFILVEQAGNYSFKVGVNDGARFYLDEELLIDAWEDRTAEQSIASDIRFLEPGLHPFTLEFYENRWVASLKLSWSSDFMEEEIIPTANFRYSLDRGPGDGTVFVIKGGPDFGMIEPDAQKHWDRSMGLNLQLDQLAPTRLDAPAGSENFGRALEFLGDLNGDGRDELGILGDVTGGWDAEALFIHHGTPHLQEMVFKTEILANSLEGEYLNFSGLFPKEEWQAPITGDGGQLTTDSAGNLVLDSSKSSDSYAYLVGSDPFDSGADISVGFLPGEEDSHLPVLSLMNYQLLEEDVGDWEKQQDSTLLRVYDNGTLEFYGKPGADPAFLETRVPGSAVEARVLLSPEHDRLSVLLDDDEVLDLAIEDWGGEIYLLLGDSLQSGDTGSVTLLSLRPGCFAECFTHNASVLSFSSGELLDNQRSELVLSGYSTLLLETQGLEVFQVVDDQETLFLGGDFDGSVYREGGLSIEYFLDCVPNGDFEEGWNNWTRTVNRRGSMDGQFEITTLEHGDWLVWKDETCSLGPKNSDYVAKSNMDNARGRNGMLVSEVFTVPDDMVTLQFWHHAKWWDFEGPNGDHWQDEIPDTIDFRLVDNQTGDIVAERRYGPDSGWEKVGEQQGLVVFELPGYSGRELRLEAEIVTDQMVVEDGLLQIDDILGVSSRTLGNYTSPFIGISGGNAGIIIPQWTGELNGGSAVLKIRTSEATTWEDAPVVENGELLHYPHGVEEFQFSFRFTRLEDELPPMIRDLGFTLFREDEMPLILNTTGEFASQLARVDPDGVDELLLNSVSREEVLVLNGSTLKDAMIGNTVFMNLDSPLMRVTSGSAQSQSFAQVTTVLSDIDGDGWRDILVSDPGKDARGVNSGEVYLFYSKGSAELTTKDAAFIYQGEESLVSFGVVMDENLVAMPFALFPRVELISRQLVDLAIIASEPMNGSLIYPNATQHLSFELANIGHLNATAFNYTLEITYLEQDSSITRKGSIDGLASRENAFVNYSWEVPLGEEYDYLMNLSFDLPGDQLQENDRVSVLLTTRYHKVLFIPETGFDSKRPGEWLNYNISVMNIGTFGPDRLNLSAILPEDWEYRFYHQGQEFEHLNISQRETIQMGIRSPLNASLVPEGYNFSVVARSKNLLPSGACELKAYLGDLDLIPVGINFYRQDGALTGENRHLVHREESRVELVVKNNGNQSSESFMVRFYQTDVLLDEVRATTLGPGEIMNISAFIIPREGEMSFFAKVDVISECMEYNEMNNQLEASTTVIDDVPNRNFRVTATIYDLSLELAQGAELRVRVGHYSRIYSATTDSRGLATLDLEPEDYFEGARLRIEAVTGSSYTYRIVYAYSEDEDANLTLVLSKFSISLEVEEAILEVYPNQEKTGYIGRNYTLWLSNSGRNSEDCELELTQPPGWDLELQGNVTPLGSQRYSMVLEPGAQEKVVLRITSEDVMSSPGEKRHHAGEQVKFHISLTANEAPFLVGKTLTAVMVPVDNLTIKVLNTEGDLYFENDRAYRDLEPGETTSFTVNLVNYGNTYKRFHLLLEGADSSGIVLDTESFLLDSLSRSGYRGEFWVNVTVPQWLGEGDDLQVDVLVLDENNSFQDQVRLGVKALKSRNISLELLEARTLDAKGTELRVEVVNPTRNPLFINLTSVTFADSGITGEITFTVTTLYLAAGERGELMFEVLLDRPCSVPEGESVFLELDFHLDNQSSVSRSLAFPARACSILLLRADRNETTLYSGEESVFHLELENQGNTGTELVSFLVQGAVKWVWIPETLRIGGAEILAIDLVVKPLPDTPNGAYGNITITPVSRDKTLHQALELVCLVQPRTRQVSAGISQYLFGQEHMNYTIWVRNEGSTVEKLQVDAFSPQGARYWLYPGELTLLPGAIKYVNLVVQNPDDSQEFGNYTIHILPKNSSKVLAALEIAGLPVSRIEVLGQDDDYVFTARSLYPLGAEFKWTVHHDLASLHIEEDDASELSLELRKAGTYTVILETIIHDPEFGSLSDICSVVVTVENTLPSLDMVPATLELVVNQSFVIDASQVLDTDGSLMELSFLYMGETFHETKLPVRFQSPGDYLVEVKAVDNLGGISEKTITITVTAGGQEPTNNEGSSQHMFTSGTGSLLLLCSLVLLVGVALLAPGLRSHFQEESEMVLKLHEMRRKRQSRELGQDAEETPEDKESKVEEVQEVQIVEVLEGHEDLEDNESLEPPMEQEVKPSKDEVPDPDTGPQEVPGPETANDPKVGTKIESPQEEGDGGDAKDLKTGQKPLDKEDNGDKNVGVPGEQQSIYKEVEQE